VFQKDPIWIKIGDFGSSKVIQKNESGPNSLVGTQSFAAPEILQLLDNAPETSEYTSAVDLWSVGCVLYYLLSRNLPFPNVKLQYGYCNQKKPRFPKHHLLAKEISSEGISFIQGLMAPLPSRRMSASTALIDPWVADETVFPQRPAEVSDIYHWQADPQEFSYQGTDGHFEQPRSVSHQQTFPISTAQHVSSDSSTVPSPHYYPLYSFIRPVVPPAEHIPSDRQTVPLPHYYYSSRQIVPPAEHNFLGRPTVRDRGRDNTAVIGDTVQHHSFQQGDTASTLYAPLDVEWTGNFRDTSGPGRKRKKRSSKKDLGADANNHYDEEFPSHVASGGDNGMANFPGLDDDVLRQVHLFHHQEAQRILYGPQPRI
jgi:serine/threonine protein kinase